MVVGGGIQGACAAREAARRGLATALIERDDFAAGTSAQPFKIVHGGIRYLQHADVARVRESSRERNALLRLAPHLVQPLPIVIPTYGRGLQGKEILGAGLLLYDLLTFDRNRGIADPARRIPDSRLLSRMECLDLFPDLERRDLTGAALFHDGQMRSPPRLVLAFVRAAVDAGADVVNHLEVTDFLRQRDRVRGVRARDVLGGDELDVRARVVLNAAGAWAEPLLASALHLRLDPPGTYSRDLAFVVPRRLSGRHGLALPGRTRDPDAIVSRKARHLFMVPWRDATLFGVWHVVLEGDPESWRVTPEELQAHLDELNAARPALGLELDDVALINAGPVLFGANRPGETDLRYGKRSRIVDHAREHGLEGLITAIAVRYTTARRVAEQAVDVVARKLGRAGRGPADPLAPLAGGRIESFEALLREALEARPVAVQPDVLRDLVHNHGSEYREVLRLGEADPGLLRTIGTSRVTAAELVHAVRNEMAVRLGDVVLRRTDLGTVSHPGRAALRVCAELMARELGWDAERVERELYAVEEVFHRHTVHRAIPAGSPPAALAG